jgi:hypothetical protein
MGMLPKAPELHRQHLLEIIGFILDMKVDHEVVGSKYIAGGGVANFGKQFDRFLSRLCAYGGEIAVLPSANENRHSENS